MAMEIQICALKDGEGALADLKPTNLHMLVRPKTEDMPVLTGVENNVSIDKVTRSFSCVCYMHAWLAA